MLIQRVIEESAIARSQIARDAGLSRAALNAWTAGRRTATPDSLRQLAGGLRTRAARLEVLAAELEAEAKG